MSNSNYSGQVITFQSRDAAKLDLDLEISEVGGEATKLLWATGSAQTSPKLLWATGSAQTSPKLLWATGSAQTSPKLLWATGSAGSAKTLVSVAA
jgi:hypothetical protein